MYIYFVIEDEKKYSQARLQGVNKGRLLLCESVILSVSRLHYRRRQKLQKKFIYFNWRLITALWWFWPYIDMNKPGVYMYPPRHSEPLLPHPSPSHPSGLPQCTGFECPASCIKLGLVINFTCGMIYVFQCYSLKSSHPHLLSQSPKVCSLLFCCLAYRVIITIFLKSI